MTVTPAPERLIAAVKRAPGRRDPAALYHQVREEAARYHLPDGRAFEIL